MGPFIKIIINKNIVVFLWSFLIVFSTTAQVAINEFMADNEQTIVDKDGDFSDWIELYNNSDEAISLLHYSLSDDDDELDKWVFPEVLMPGRSFLLVFASGKNIYNSLEFHANFKIKSSGEPLFLCDAQGAILDQTPSVALQEDQSFGSYPDGGTEQFCLNYASPNAANLGNNQLIFSHSAGFYKKPFGLLVKDLTGDSLFYTTDGSVPSTSDVLFQDSMFLDFLYQKENHFSEIPSSPAQELISNKAWEKPDNRIEKAHIIRVASFKNGLQTSPVYTRTFFIDSTAYWRNLPLISLVSSPENLFAYDSGLFVPGQYYNSNLSELSGNYFERGVEWERPVCVEYFDTTNTLRLSQNAGLRIHGGKTRQAAQKSLRLYARKEYGPKYFNYPFLPNREIKQYKRILLRASMGVSFQSNATIKDVLAHHLVRDFDMEYQEYQPAVVFVNGEYWGFFTLRDRIDERYIAYLYDLDKDDVEFSEANENWWNLMLFVENNNLMSKDNYEYVIGQIDIDSYVDYQIAELFFGNRDWPANNQKCWRQKKNKSLWRWIFYDLDDAFVDAEYNMLKHATLNQESVSFPNPPHSTLLFRKLLENEAFKHKFIAKMAYHLNQSFKLDYFRSLVPQIKNSYQKEMPKHIERWHYPSSLSDWHNDIERDISDFLETRSCYMEFQMREFFHLSSFDFDCEPYQINPEDHLSLAPNPSNGFFYIYNNSSSEIITQARVISLSGQLVFSNSNLHIMPQNKHYFYLRELSQGTYILELSGGVFV
ncbi:MAG: hypothetical protein B7C24_16555, partial [Bacteroidetes bacterium 4572_77]